MPPSRRSLAGWPPRPMRRRARSCRTTWKPTRSTHSGSCGRTACRASPLRRAAHEAPEIAHLSQSDERQALIFIVYGVLLIAAVGYALRSWVLRPLRSIGRSLAENDPQQVAALSAEKSELGEVARLVQTSFE